MQVDDDNQDSRDVPHLAGKPILLNSVFEWITEVEAGKDNQQNWVGRALSRTLYQGWGRRAKTVEL